MLIANIVGGLGNQMFQYAMAKSMAIENEAHLQLDLSAYRNKRYFNPEGFLLEKVFGAECIEASTLDYAAALGINYLLLPLIKRGKLHSASNRIIRESRLFEYDSNLIGRSHRTRAYIQGYWQTENYFRRTEGKIRDLFQFKPSMISERSRLLESRIRERESVAVHIRRGDYITNPVYSKMYHICDENYYSNAFEFITSRISNPEFFIFTNDIEWAASQDIFRNATICTASEDGSWNDMYLMSICKHNIVANSSFSWWGAWLNSNRDKIVISPSTWFIDGTTTPDLIPNTWTTID